MDLGKAFGFVFEDEKWVSKMLVGGVIGIFGSFIIIGPIVLLGYMVEVAQNVMRGNPRPLPDWSDFGAKLGKGFALFVVSLVYSIPIILVACVMGGIIGAVAGASGDSEEAVAAASGLIFCMYGLSFLLALIIMPFTLAAQVRYVQYGTISSALQFGEVLALVRNNLGAVLMIFLISILASIVGQLGAIACGIGLFITIPYAQVILGHVLGQTAARLSGGMQTMQSPPSSYSPPPTF
jgi:hypothetical protein